jgi:glucan phosphoethanolaminetransferase (alkaline phosphatase superfamily)
MLGQPLATAAAGPRRRNALMTFLMPLGVMVVGAILASILRMIFGPLAMLGNVIQLAGAAWTIILAITMINELKSVTRNDAFAWWPIFVPIYGIYWACVLVPQEVTKAKQILGVQQPARPLVLYLFLFLFALASDINDLSR